jgi:hypothetical protein
MVIRHVPPDEYIDAIRPRRGKRPDHRAADETQDKHHSRNLKQGHVHEKSPHSSGGVTKRNGTTPWLQFTLTSVSRRNLYAKREDFIDM